MPEYGITAMIELFASLDETLSVALKEGSLASACLTPPRQHGLEMFLCALHRRCPDRLHSYFSDPGAFNALNAALWPAKVLADHPAWTREGREDLGGEFNTAAGFHIELQPDLTRILLNAARISFALLHKNTSLPDLIASLATEAELCELLKSSWGISLKGLPAGLPEAR
jgi:hypothetical protein